MSRWPSYFLFAALVIPTKSMDGWRTENFSHIKSNEVSASHKGILVRVRKSASPLIFPLKATEIVTGLKVSGEFFGLPKFSNIAQQGQKGSDDYALRIGLVVPGENRLSGFKKLFASQWVKHLYSQVPSNLGLDHIHFFNITQNPSQVGETRLHSASDLIKEEFIASVEKAGPFKYEYALKYPLKAVAVWISIDGDDTKSNYEVLIAKLELIAEKRSP